MRVSIMPEGTLDLLKARITAGEIDRDPAQIDAAARLNTLATAMNTWRPGRGWSLTGLFRSRDEPPRGLYIHGQVGRGKTMLMDLFFESVAFEPKRRIHFHEFMAEIHERIGEARKTVNGDPIPHVAEQVAAGCGLLCFDELHVTDIADAMILGRLFTGLFARRVVMVATSNSHPRDLYRNGLNRELFLPFIDLIERHMDVLELDAAKDFRLDKLSGRPLYFTPLSDISHRELRAAFARLTGVARGSPMDLNVKSRILRVLESARGVAYFTFADLCEAPLGTLDFLHIAHAFHTIIIEGIPQLRPEMRSVTRRFVNLIDTLYDAHVGLIASAAAEPDQLYTGNDVLFERTVSRLTEMRGEAYLARRNTRVDQAAPAI
jgi:cell division protein ZapE